MSNGSDEEFTGYTPSGPDPEDYAEWQAQQPRPPIDAMIERVLVEFDFDTVYAVHVLLGWKTPKHNDSSIEGLRGEARKLLTEAVDEYQRLRTDVDVVVAGWRIEVKSTQVILSFEVTSATVPNCVRS